MAGNSTFSGSAVFWSLPPLAFNMMLQPSGRPCGFHVCCRTYLRAMPFVCAADAMSITIRWLVNRCAGVHWRQAAAAALESRRICFAECNCAEPRESTHDLEGNASLRLLAFSYAMAPVSIKLYFVEGIFWTKFFAFMYIVSFLIVEIVLWAADSRPAAAESKLPTLQHPVHQLQQRWNRNMEPLHRALGVLAFVAQIFLAYCVWPTSANDMSPAQQWLMIFVGSLVPVMADLIKSRWLKALPPEMYLGVSLQLTLGVCWLYLRMWGIVAGPLSENPWYYDLIALLVSYVVPAMIFGYLLSTRLGRIKLCFLPVERNDALECEAIVIFASFCVMTCSAFMWYRILYNAELTSKPAWLEWLG